MKKYILIVAALSIVPSIAFASWWNPLTWNIFSSHQPNPPVQVISTTTPLNQTFTDNSTTTATTTISVATTTEVIVATTSTPKINVPVKKVIPSINTPSPTTPTCPAGYTCTVPVQTQTSQQTQTITDQQSCENSYGPNSSYSGQKNSSGGQVCGCKDGYAWNSDRTSCQLSQTSWTDLENEWFAKATQNICLHQYKEIR